MPARGSRGERAMAAMQRLAARLRRPVGDPSRRVLARAPERVKVDAHHDASQGRTADLGEAGVGEHALGADVELLGDHVLRGHRVALDGAGAARAGEVHRGARERPADAALAEARAGEEAGHGPDAVVGLVLRAALPGDAVVAQQARVGGARLDRAPADGLAVEVRDEAAGRVRLRMAAVGLLAQPVGAFLGGERARRTPAAAACTAGTGTWTPGRACRRPSAGPPSSPRWRARRRSQVRLSSCARLCREPVSGGSAELRHRAAVAWNDAAVHDDAEEAGVFRNARSSRGWIGAAAVAAAATAGLVPTSAGAQDVRVSFERLSGFKAPGPRPASTESAS